MPLFSSRPHHDYDTTGYGHGSSARNNTHNHATGHSHHKAQGFGFFRRKHPERVAAGYRAALANPNTTHNGRAHAKHELHKRGYSAHVPIMTRIKRTLGIRSSPRRQNVNHSHADLYH